MRWRAMRGLGTARRLLSSEAVGAPVLSMSQVQHAAVRLVRPAAVKNGEFFLSADRPLIDRLLIWLEDV